MAKPGIRQRVGKDGISRMTQRGMPNETGGPRGGRDSELTCVGDVELSSGRLAQANASGAFLTELTASQPRVAILFRLASAPLREHSTYMNPSIVFLPLQYSLQSSDS